MSFTRYVWLVVWLALLGGCAAAQTPALEVSPPPKVTGLVRVTSSPAALVSPTMPSPAAPTIAVTPSPSPSPTPLVVTVTPVTATRQPPESPTDFPLRLGSTWVYSATYYDTFESERITATYRITETVVETQTQAALSVARIERVTTLRTTSANLTGKDWQEFYLAGAGGSTSSWFVRSGNRLYQQPELDGAAVAADEASLEYIFPLSDGAMWYPDPAQRAQFPNFEIGPGLRTVSGPLDRQGPAGEFMSCYELRTFYNGGSPVSWFCPEVGVVEAQFDHVGTPFGHRLVLEAYTLEPIAEVGSPAPLVELIVSPAAAAVGDIVSPLTAEPAPLIQAVNKIELASSVSQATWHYYPLPAASGQPRRLLIDSAGQVWLGNPGGVHILLLDDTGQAAWLTFTGQHGLPDAFVTDLAFDSQGRVWAATMHGTATFDGLTWTAHTAAEGLTDEAVYGLAGAPDGRVWASTDAGIKQFEGGAWSTVAGAPPALGRITFEPSGRVWGALTGGGLALFDGTNWTPFHQAAGFDLHNVNDIYLDQAGNVWISSGACYFTADECANAGLSRFDGQQWHNFRTTLLRNNHYRDLVWASMVDPTGAVWTTIDTVYRFDGHAWESHVRYDGLPGQPQQLAIDNQGRVWVATEQGVGWLEKEP